jgi:hypothetical protein
VSFLGKFGAVAASFARHVMAGLDPAIYARAAVCAELAGTTVIAEMAGSSPAMT